MRKIVDLFFERTRHEVQLEVVMEQVYVVFGLIAVSLILKNTIDPELFKQWRLIDNTAFVSYMYFRALPRMGLIPKIPYHLLMVLLVVQAVIKALI